jgi:hypothetical protein
MRWLQCSVLALQYLLIASASMRGQNALPAFSKDTVLVWQDRNQDYSSDFVVRIAEFLPDRFVEWEDSKTQGTIFMSNRDIISAKGFVGANLFASGMDTRGKNATTLWLSKRIFEELKDKKKTKCDLDGITSTLTYVGEDEMEVEVNRSPMRLPVIKVADDRGSERWFLNHADNPLMLKLTVRGYTQVLRSITTDRQNTLRWIKGKKLNNLPQ